MVLPIPSGVAAGAGPAVGAGGLAAANPALAAASFGLSSVASALAAPAGPAISESNPIRAGDIIVAPPSTNLGELLKPLQDPVTTGGFGLNTKGRLFSTSAGVAGGGVPLLLLAGIAGAAFLLFRKKR